MSAGASGPGDDPKGNCPQVAHPTPGSGEPIHRPELIDRLGHPKAPKDRDFRLAIIWLAIAVGLVLIGFAVPEEDAFRGTLAGAAFPFTIGIAYLILNKFAKRDD